MPGRLKEAENSCVRYPNFMILLCPCMSPRLFSSPKREESRKSWADKVDHQHNLPGLLTQQPVATYNLLVQGTKHWVNKMLFTQEKNQYKGSVYIYHIEGLSPAGTLQCSSAACGFLSNHTIPKCFCALSFHTSHTELLQICDSHIIAHETRDKNCSANPLANNLTEEKGRKKKRKKTLKY